MLMKRKGDRREGASPIDNDKWRSEEAVKDSGEWRETESEVRGPKARLSNTVPKGEKAPSPKVEGREGPTTNSRVTHSPISAIGGVW